MARLQAARRGDRIRIEGANDPADPDADLYETGALLPSEHATLAGPTFEEWLDASLHRIDGASGSTSSAAIDGAERAGVHWGTS
jgi:hypothetical protein